MADEVAQAAAPDSGAKQKMFSTKGLILVVVIFLFYTAGLYYLLRGDMGKATDESAVSNVLLKETQERLLKEQNSIPPFLLDEIIVPIKLDKNGDTAKNVFASFSIHLGLTQIEETALEEGVWEPRRKDLTRFQKSIDKSKYENSWSLVDEVLGPDGLNKKLGENKDSYLWSLSNAKEKIRSKVNEILLSTTYSELNTEDGRANIADRIKVEVNDILYELGQFKRVYKVNWTKFFFQQ